MKQKRFWKFRYIFLTAFVLTLGMCAYFGFKGYAADSISVESAGEDVTNKVVEMRQKEIQLEMKSTGNIYEDSSLYDISWTIEGSGNNVIAKVEKSPSAQSVAIVTALSPGTVRITVTVRDKVGTIGAVLATTGCDVQVVFSIDTTKDDTVFKHLYEDSTEKALFLYADNAEKQLALNFGDASNAQWTSRNTEIVTVGQLDGKVQAVGAGKTFIEASYTPDGDTVTYTAVLPVYVIPRVTNRFIDYENNTFARSLDIGMKRGESLYLDTKFGDNNIEPLGDKVEWVIKQDEGTGRKVIANSLPGGLRSDLISLEPESSKSGVLNVQAKAGIYYIELYTAGTYVSEAKKVKAYTPTTITLTVYANFANYSENMLVGDSYHLANAFNLTVSDFNKYFDSPILSYGSGSAANYATYSSADTTVRTQNAAVLDVKVSAKDANKIVAFTDPASPIYGKTTFNITLNVLDSFLLDRTNCIISVGQSLQLNAIMSGSSNGHIEWTSADKSFVTVDSTGMIKGVKTTTSDIVVTASLVDETGAIIKNATCVVKVEAAVSGFTLNPTELTMKIGDTSTVKAELKQAVSVAPLVWSSLDPSIATVTAAADGKSAIVTAKKGGDTYITVYNTVNKQQEGSIKVSVLIGITELSFTEQMVTGKIVGGTTTKAISVSYSPKDSNRTNIVWTSRDTSIATISANGKGENGIALAMVTMKKPGKVYLTAAPEYNPMAVLAVCEFTILEPATAITIMPTSVTLKAKYGSVPAETSQLVYAVTPANATTSITYNSLDPSVATVDNTGLIRAVKAGSTYVTVQTEENLIQQCKVNVLQPCESVAVTPVIYTMLNGATYKPSVAMKPADATDSLSWKSFDTSVVTAETNGMLSAKKVGSTIVQVTAQSGASAFLQIIVQDGLKSLELNYNSYSLEKGSSFSLIPKFNPETAYDKTLKWTSSNSSVASMEEKKDGDMPYLKVNGLKGGMTVITATSNDGGYVASCVVLVSEKVTKVSISPTTKYLQKGKTFTVKATVSSADASNKKVSWSTSKKSVATVNSSGKVTGKKLGTAYIKATAKDGSKVSAQCKVVVIRSVTKVRLNKYTAKMLVGKSMLLKKYITPKNASVKSVGWSSSNNNIATVDSSGRVLALAPGMVKIRAKATDGSGKSAICLINVVEPVEATGVSVSNAEIIVARGRAISSGIAISPANSTDSIKYFSDNKKVATINKYGKIKTKRTGQVTVYGKTSNGKYGYTDVLVVGMNRTTLKMRQFDKEKLSVNEINTGITWHSSNPMVASVTNGSVLGRKPGRATIYATVRGLKLPCRVKIIKIK